jgi:hypothetical protein
MGNFGKPKAKKATEKLRSGDRKPETENCS